jgi:sterol 14-demethylase
MGLSIDNLRNYVSLIEEETKSYFNRWSEPTGVQELSIALAELTIMTASRCLMGPEVRSKLDESVAQLYHDLDQGFQPINFLFERLPLPSYWRRDAAHVKMRNIFMNIMENRREESRLENPDVLQALMDASYKNGTKLSDKEAAHLMIALLMAGQHTSSTTGTWAISYLAANPDIYTELEEEIAHELGGLALNDPHARPLDFDSLKRMPLLDSIVRETLRMRPPILSIMRKVVRPLEYKGYVIPVDHYVCAAPAVSQLDEEAYEAPEEWRPHRWLDTEGSAGAKMAGILKAENDQSNAEDFGFGLVGGSARSHYLPFGAGRHRCIGEPFAYVQLKTILATFVREFSQLKFPEGSPGFPKRDFTSMIVMPTKPVTVEYVRRHPVEVAPHTAATAF